MFEKRIEWDPAKNLKIQMERGISFEQIQLAVESGCVLDITAHTNSRYAHQQVMAIDIEGYVVLVPFVETAEIVFLKTAFPSRKATRDYLQKGR